jgi:hypothetical protein
MRCNQSLRLLRDAALPALITQLHAKFLLLFECLRLCRRLLRSIIGSVLPRNSATTCFAVIVIAIVVSPLVIGLARAGGDND